MGKFQSLVFFVGLTVILTIASLVYYSSEARSIRDVKFKELKAISELKINQITQWQKERYSEAGFFSKNKLVIDATVKLIEHPAPDTSLVSFFKPITSFDRYENILITDTLARVIFSMNNEFKLDNKTISLILKAREKKEIYFSGFYYCRLHNKILDDFIAPVISNRKLTGFLVLRNDPERYLYPLIQKWPLPSSTSETILVVREHDSVVFVNDVRFISNAALKFKEPLENNDIAATAAAGQTGLFEGPDYKGSKVLAYLSPVSGTPWTMVAKIDKKEVMAELKYRAIVVITAVTGILIIASLGLILMNRSKQTNLLKELSKTLEDRVKQRTIQLEEVNKELETFTYSVSHDLKAPLRGVDGYSKLLLDKSESWLDDESKHYLKSIRSSAKLMNQLIKDLLEYSRVERSRISNETIRVKKLAESLLTVFQGSIAKNYMFSLNIPDTEIIADMRGLTIILRNLLENAIKFSGSKPEPHVSIDFCEDNSFWTISIKDNGIGFDMKYKNRIFEIFHRLHRSEDYPGTGIGLALVAKAAQRMRCHVLAESVPTEGSVFYLQIPKN